jgi:hypothetical protein
VVPAVVAGHLGHQARHPMVSVSAPSWEVTMVIMVATCDPAGRLAELTP